MNGVHRSSRLVSFCRNCRLTIETFFHPIGKVYICLSQFIVGIGQLHIFSVQSQFPSIFLHVSLILSCICVCVNATYCLIYPLFTSFDRKLTYFSTELMYQFQYIGIDRIYWNMLKRVFKLYVILHQIQVHLGAQFYLRQYYQSFYDLILMRLSANHCSIRHTGGGNGCSLLPGHPSHLFKEWPIFLARGLECFLSTLLRACFIPPHGLP